MQCNTSIFCYGNLISYKNRPGIPNLFVPQFEKKRTTHASRIFKRISRMYNTNEGWKIIRNMVRKNLIILLPDKKHIPLLFSFFLLGTPEGPGKNNKMLLSFFSSSPITFPSLLPVLAPQGVYRVSDLVGFREEVSLPFKMESQNDRR